LKTSYILYLVLFIIIQLSCTTEDEIISDNPDYQLTFSSDTITFDTVFTSLGSVSKRLMVHNPNPNALIIEKIYVGNGMESPYSITVGGKESNFIENQHILGNDSLLVLVSVTIDPTAASLPFVVRDSIVFITNDNLQNVKLQSWGQNAHFLGDSILSCETTWIPDLPYFLFGSILVDSLCTLTIEKGVQVYSSFDTYIFIKGSLSINGTADERVLFRNERLEPKYENVPGQWGGIIFLEGSKNNFIEYADIRNVQYGIRLGTPDNDTIPDLILKHVRIENSATGGIMAFTSDLIAENTLVNTSAGFTVGNIAGGNYTYNHCTIVNYPIDFFSGQSSLVMTDNLDLDDGNTITEPLNIKIFNSIIWGYLDEEVIVNVELADEFKLLSQNSIFKTSLDIFEGEGNFISTETDFMQFANIENYDYTPDSLSPAVDNAIGSEMLIDLFENQRDSLPDIGAIEYLFN